MVVHLILRPYTSFKNYTRISHDHMRGPILAEKDATQCAWEETVSKARSKTNTPYG